MIDLGALWRTVKHLRREQILGRARFRLIKPRPDLGPAPPTRQQTGKWVLPPARDPSMHSSGVVRFLGQERALRTTAWDDPSESRLWRYNLHYFDDLNARRAEERSQIHHRFVQDWIRGNPPGAGTGWEPYPTSLRIVNWIKWFLREPSASRPDYLHSLAIQARWLARRLEFHLLGNHLFANAKAMVFAGAYFEGQEARKWYEIGAHILDRELPEQVLADGGQFELSPMYHALAVEDVLDLINLLGAFEIEGSSRLQGNLVDLVPKMITWLWCMSHPNGDLATFNDCAGGIAPRTDDLVAYSRRLHLAQVKAPDSEMVHLDSSGYVRMTSDSAVAILDVGAVGPDYLPAHAHADTLSFELSIGSQRVIVNGGTSCYEAGEQRSRERSTALHSTVEVGGLNSSEVWGAFRVGRRARPHDLAVSQRTVCCSHDGYRFLKGHPTHRRCWRFENSSLLVEDTVSVPTIPAVARFLLAPGLQVQSLSDGHWAIVRGEVSIAVIRVERGIGRVEASTHAPRFGTVVETCCICVHLSRGCAATRIILNPDLAKPDCA